MLPQLPLNLILDTRAVKKSTLHSNIPLVTVELNFIELIISSHRVARNVCQILLSIMLYVKIGLNFKIGLQYCSNDRSLCFENFLDNYEKNVLELSI